METFPALLRSGFLSEFPLRRYSRIFRYCKNTCYLLNITFIFDMRRSSSAAMAPVKYICDSDNLRCTIARSKILLTEKFKIAALVTPPPGPLCGKFIGHWWFAFKNASDVDVFFHLRLNKRLIKQSISWQFGTLIMTSLSWEPYEMQITNMKRNFHQSQHHSLCW